MKAKAIIEIDPNSKNYGILFKRGSKIIQFDDLSIDEKYTLIKSLKAFEAMLSTKFSTR